MSAFFLSADSTFRMSPAVQQSPNTPSPSAPHRRKNVIPVGDIPDCTCEMGQTRVRGTPNPGRPDNVHHHCRHCDGCVTYKPSSVIRHEVMTHSIRHPGVDIDECPTPTCRRLFIASQVSEYERHLAMHYAREMDPTMRAKLDEELERCRTSGRKKRRPRDRNPLPQSSQSTHDPEYDSARDPEWAPSPRPALAQPLRPLPSLAQHPSPPPPPPPPQPAVERKFAGLFSNQELGLLIGDSSANDGLKTVHFLLDLKLHCRLGDCNFHADVLSDMRDHIREGHRKKAKDQKGFCQLCNFAPKKYVKFENHLKEKHGILPGANYPDSITEVSDGLAKTSKPCSVHFQDGMALCQLQGCTFQATALTDIVTHLETEHQQQRDNLNGFFCESCVYEVDTFKDFDQHIEKKHSPPRPISLDDSSSSVIDLTSSSLIDLTEDVAPVTSVGPKPKIVFTADSKLLCPVENCGFRATLIMSLKLHLRANHQQSAVILEAECQVCDLQFAAFSKFHRHLVWKHSVKDREEKKGESEKADVSPAAEAARSGAPSSQFPARVYQGNFPSSEIDMSYQADKKLHCHVDWCTFVCFALDNMKTHLSSRHSKSRTSIKSFCGVCDMKYSGCPTFERHVVWKHSVEIHGDAPQSARATPAPVRTPRVAHSVPSLTRDKLSLPTDGAVITLSIQRDNRMYCHGVGCHLVATYFDSVKDHFKEQHGLTVNAIGNSYCAICNFVYPLYRSFTQHCAWKHNISFHGDVPSRGNDAPYTAPRSVEKLVIRFMSDGKIHCFDATCPFITVVCSDMAEHLRFTHGKAITRVQGICEVCGPHFSNFYNFRSHLKLRHGLQPQGEKDSKMLLGDDDVGGLDDFSWGQKMLRFNKETHRLHCYQCEFSAATTNDIAMHVRSVHQHKLKNVYGWCELCSNDYNTTSYFFSHVKQKHGVDAGDRNSGLMSFSTMDQEEDGVLHEKMDDTPPYGEFSATAPDRTVFNPYMVWTRDSDGELEAEPEEDQETPSPPPGPAPVAQRRRPAFYEEDGLHCFDETCDFVTDNISGLRVHVHVAHDVKFKDLQGLCELCGEVYKKFGEFKAHVMEEHDVEIGDVAEERVRQSRTTRQQRRVEEAEQSVGERISCRSDRLLHCDFPKCRFTTKFLIDAREHVLSAHAVSDMVGFCKICDVAHAKYSTFKQHVITSHGIQMGEAKMDVAPLVDKQIEAQSEKNDESEKKADATPVAPSSPRKKYLYTNNRLKVCDTPIVLPAPSVECLHLPGHERPVDQATPAAVIHYSKDGVLRCRSDGCTFRSALCSEMKLHLLSAHSAFLGSAQGICMICRSRHKYTDFVKHLRFNHAADTKLTGKENAAFNISVHSSTKVYCSGCNCKIRFIKGKKDILQDHITQVHKTSVAKVMFYCQPCAASTSNYHTFMLHLLQDSHKAAVGSASSGSVSAVTRKFIRGFELRGVFPGLQMPSSDDAAAKPTQSKAAREAKENGLPEVAKETKAPETPAVVAADPSNRKADSETLNGKEEKVAVEKEKASVHPAEENTASNQKSDLPDVFADALKELMNLNELSRQQENGSTEGIERSKTEVGTGNGVAPGEKSAPAESEPETKASTAEAMETETSATDPKAEDKHTATKEEASTSSLPGTGSGDKKVGPDERKLQITCVGEDLLKCSECPQFFPHVRRVREHLDDWHPRQGATALFRCALCDATYRQSAAFHGHLSSAQHRIAVLLSVYPSDEEADSGDEEPNQIRSAGSVVAPHDKQPVNGDTLRENINSAVRRHMVDDPLEPKRRSLFKVEIRADEKLYCCVCSYNDTVEDRMRKHITEKHDEKLSFTYCYCNPCGRDYNSYWPFKYHVTQIHGVRETEEMQSATPSLKIDVTEDGLVRCTSCRFTSEDAEHVRNHAVYAHNVKRVQMRFDCAPCGMTTWQYNNFVSHLKFPKHLKIIEQNKSQKPPGGVAATPNGEVSQKQGERKDLLKFVCGECPQKPGFQTMQDLAEHKRTDHPNTRSAFRCRTCDVIVPTHESFMEHLRTKHPKAYAISYGGGAAKKPTQDAAAPAVKVQGASTPAPAADSGKHEPAPAANVTKVHPPAQLAPDADPEEDEVQIVPQFTISRKNTSALKNNESYFDGGPLQILHGRLSVRPSASQTNIGANDKAKAVEAQKIPQEKTTADENAIAEPGTSQSTTGDEAARRFQASTQCFCNVCRSIFQTTREFEAHLVAKHPGIEALVTCRACGFGFKSKRSLLAHLSSHEHKSRTARSESKSKVKSSQKVRSVSVCCLKPVNAMCRGRRPCSITAFCSILTVFELIWHFFSILQ